MAAVEQYSNRVITRLDGDISDSTTTIVVESSTGAPTTGQFRALIGNEIFLVTAVTGTTWTVVRGQEGTSAENHLDNDSVTLVVTVESLLGLSRQSHNGINVAARRELDFIDNSQIAFALTDDPTNKKTLVEAVVLSGGTPYIERPIVAPVDADWAWVNQTVATRSVGPQNSIKLFSLNNGSVNTDQLHLLVHTVPATPWTAYFRLQVQMAGGNFNNAGVCFLDAANKISSIGVLVQTASQWNMYQWNSPTSWNNSAAVYNTSSPGNFPIWYRLQDNGTNRIYSVGFDGDNFITTYTASRTNFLTATQVGFYVNPYSVGGCFAALSSFEITSP